MKATDSTSSSDEIAVFQAYIDPHQLGAGDHLGGHNALLVANSLIVGELAISPTALLENKWATFAMLSTGLLIRAAWVGITVLGWSAMRRHADLAGTFASACFKIPNPFAETICNRAQARIYHHWLCPSLANLGMECLR